MKINSKLLLPVVALAASAVIASAQENKDAKPPKGEGDRGERGDRRGSFNIEDFRKQMGERMKTALKVTDDEWAVLQPLIEKVSTKRMEMGSRGGFGGPPGGDRRGGDRGPGGGDRSPSGAPGGGAPGGGDQSRGGSPESQALRTALESESTSADDIKAKLTALRDSRKKTTAEIEAARAELQKVVTVRQEAVLVGMGILE